MKIMFIISLIIICFYVINYKKMSYKEWYKRCEVNAKHPDWHPNCRIDFLRKDPQWFIDNGYGEYTYDNVKSIFKR